MVKNIEPGIANVCKLEKKEHKIDTLKNFLFFKYSQNVN